MALNLSLARELGERMLAAAHCGDWNTVFVLGAERAPLVLHDSTGAEHAHTLHVLMDQDGALLQLAMAARGAVADALGRHHHAHHALRSYVELND